MKNKIVFSLAIMLGIILINHSCYAAVEIVPSKTGNGKDAIVNTTVSNSYLLCQGMTGTGESLQGATVKPHLATNKDWGAVSYLSNSIYGTNTTGGNTGVNVSINGVNYYSTTTNITGVMNWGSNPNVTRYTQTAGLINSYDPDTSSVSSNFIELYNNRDSKYVDYINPKDSSSTTGIPLEKPMVTGAWLESNNNFPGSMRVGLRQAWFGSTHAGITYSFSPNGSANGNVTFRPVVWN